MKVKTCTFFGNADTPSIFSTALRSEIIRMIQQNDVQFFYLGHNGNFDQMVLQSLRDIKKMFPKITYKVVLAYPSRFSGNSACYLQHELLFLDALQKIHPRQAIPWRNRWMIDHSEYVIACVQHDGGAAHYMQRAILLGKKVVNICENTNLSLGGIRYEG